MKKFNYKKNEFKVSTDDGKLYVIIGDEEYTKDELLSYFKTLKDVDKIKEYVNIIVDMQGLEAMLKAYGTCFGRLDDMTIDDIVNRLSSK